jgi:hypothetical protein
MMILKGERGDKGVKGERGDRGKRGEPGKEYILKEYHRFKILNWTSYFTLLIAFGFLVYYLYMNFYPFRILEFDNETTANTWEVHVLTPQVKAGEEFKYEQSFKKLIDLPGKVSCYFEDGIVYRLSDELGSNPIVENRFVRSMKAPITLMPDKYKFGCDIEYELPMGRIIIYHFITDVYINII